MVEKGVAKLEYWEAWESSAKVLCQWLNPINHRRWLKVKVRQIGGERLGERLVSLNKGCDRFAKWRWKTLGNVTRDLLRLQNAFRVGIDRVQNINEISSRSPASDAKLWEIGS